MPEIMLTLPKVSVMTDVIILGPSFLTLWSIDIFVLRLVIIYYYFTPSGRDFFGLCYLVVFILWYLSFDQFVEPGA